MMSDVITDGSRADLEQQLQLFRRALDCLPISINIKDASGRYAFINAFQARNAGMAAKDIIGKQIGVAVPGNDTWMTIVRERDRQVLETGEAIGPYREDFAAIFGFAGTWLSYKVPVSMEEGGCAAHVITVSFDITSFVDAENRLRTAAYTDALTGLYNRRWLDEELERIEADQMRASQRRTWLLLIDADHFKAINDRHGHDVGDWVLREVGARLKKSIRFEDAVVRLGGEEFVALIRNVTGDEAAQAAERIRAAFDGNSMLDVETAPSITVSIGAAPAGHAVGANSALRRADRALYLAKETGRNRVIMAEDPVY
jgi:diguanylate cyclase (GGDEF)-like protein